MAWCPFALHKPLSENHTQGAITPRAVILHTAVSNAVSLFDYFQNSSDLESHFYVNAAGVVEQYIDTGRRADANRDANGFAVSIETWDGGTIRPWTQVQVDALVRLVDWLCSTHGIPRAQIPRWDGAGIGWHVQFGAPGPWTPVAKSCPGQPRIDQTKHVIIPRVAAGQITGESMDPNNPHDSAVMGRVQSLVLGEETRSFGAGSPEPVPFVVDSKSAYGRMQAVLKMLPTVQWGPATGETNDLAVFLQGIKADLVAVRSVVAGLSDDEANLLAAIQAVHASVQALADGQVDEVELANLLAPALAPLIQLGVTEEQVEAALRRVFASAGQPEGN